MSRKRPTDEELEALLKEGHFGAAATSPGSTDPLTPTPMVVEVERIKPYDRNPRRERNPLYDEIKASIQAQGLKQPLVITRRPGETEHFMVKVGGNTRLEILKRLHAETGEARFARVHCLYEPWTSESDTLAAHLIENDTRGDLTFIDRARAVRDLKELIEAEAGEPMTQAALAAAAAERGYRLDRSLISRMDYALDVLLPRIPEALRAGLGRDHIQRIRKLERAAARVWRERSLGDEAKFEATFGELLARHDGPEWRFDALRRSVENELAVSADEEVPRISMAIDALMAGREPLGPEALEAVANTPPWPPPRASTRARPSEPGEGEAADAFDDEFDEEDRVETEALDPDEDAFADMLVTGRAGPSDRKSLRARAWVLATRIAKRHHLGDIVVPLKGRGCGFLVDFVYTSPVDQPDVRLGHATLWWFLATCSEQFFVPAEQVLPHLPETWAGKPIARAISDPDLGSHTDLLAEYTLLGFGHLMGPLVFARVTENTWTDLLHLIDTYRRLKRDVESEGGDLWEDAR